MKSKLGKEEKNKRRLMDGKDMAESAILVGSEYYHTISLTVNILNWPTINRGGFLYVSSTQI